jgi:hypothetical protein
MTELLDPALGFQSGNGYEKMIGYNLSPDGKIRPKVW